MRIEDILHSTVALDRIQKQKQTEAKGMSLRLLRESQDEVGLLRQTDEKLLALRDREQTFMRHEVIVYGLELLRKRVGEFARTPVEQRDYELFSQELQQIVNGTRFQGETPLASMSVKIADEKSLYTLSQQIDQEIAIHQNRMRQERKQIAAFLVTEENQEALAGKSSETLLAELRDAMQKETEYPLKKSYSFAQIVKIL
ncbi:MAG: hypothetical protein N2314_01480 [Brevinematales bacterium]|nr:hypothetical protein [Brevinematales bacterium]